MSGIGDFFDEFSLMNSCLFFAVHQNLSKSCNRKLASKFFHEFYWLFFQCFCCQTSTPKGNKKTASYKCFHKRSSFIYIHIFRCLLFRLFIYLWTPRSLTLLTLEIIVFSIWNSTGEILPMLIPYKDDRMTLNFTLWTVAVSNFSLAQPVTLLKKELWHRCFPANFKKFLRTPFLQNTSGGCYRKAFTETSHRRVLKSSCPKKFHKISCSNVAESFFDKMTG